MGNKNKTVSFRVNESTFEELREIASNQDVSLSAVFRDYVSTFIANEGHVRVSGKEVGTDADSFPANVVVPTSFVRDHELLELEVEQLELEITHLREQLHEAQSYIDHLHGSEEDPATFLTTEDTLRPE